MYAQILPRNETPDAYFSDISVRRPGVWFYASICRYIIGVDTWSSPATMSVSPSYLFNVFPQKRASFFPRSVHRFESHSIEITIMCGIIAYGKYIFVKGFRTIDGSGNVYH